MPQAWHGPHGGGIPSAFPPSTLARRVYLGLLLLSLCAYAVQGVLISGLARRHDLLWVCTVRGLGLLVLMAPLVLLAPAGALARLPAFAAPLALACAGAMAANLCQTYAVRHLPMAIANAICQGSTALGTLALEIAWFGHWPSAAELACVSGILAGVSLLSWLSSRGQVLGPEARPLRGVLVSLGFGAAMSGALIPLAIVSRGVDPFIAAWAWEGGIGLVGLLLVVARAAARRAPAVPAGGVWLRIALYGAPTVVGTGAYTWATTIGSLAVAGAVLSTMMVATALLALAIHRERLRTSQWGAIGAICAVLLALGLAKPAKPPPHAPRAAVAR